MADEKKQLEKWKKKYYSTLEEMEEKEKSWRESDAFLRRTLSHLSLVGDGLDERLDGDLERLRNTVRKERNDKRLQKLVDHIVDVANDISKKKTADSMESRIFLQLADNLELPKNYKRACNKLKKDLKGNPDPDAQLATVAGFINAIAGSHEAEATKQQTGTREKTGLMDKLFTRTEAFSRAESQTRQINESTLVLPASGEDARGDNAGNALVSLLEMLRFLDKQDKDYSRVRQHALNLSDKKDLMRLLEEMSSLISKYVVEITSGDDVISESEQTTIHEILIQLLERLDITQEMSQRAEELKERWEQGLSEDDLPLALESIASLVMEMRSNVEKEKQDFETFLKDLSDRLREIDQHIIRAEKTHEASLEDSRKLDAVVTEQMDGIRSSINEETDLNILKVDISRRLDGIKTHMRLFLDAEEDRFNDSQEHIQELTGKMKHLEQEADSLKTRIIEEHRMALLDPLTGLNNRMAYSERLEQEYNRWKRYQTPLSLLVWDIDHFKKINDTYGHKSGDKALKTISSVIKSNMRETDFVARYGGEEFVALLPETEIEGARQVAEKIRKTVENSEFHYHGDRVLITITCGIAAFQEGDTPDSVFERADKNLYSGKSAGRNRVYADGDHL